MSYKIFEVMGRHLIHINKNQLKPKDLKCRVQLNKSLYGEVYSGSICVYYNKKGKPFVAELIDDYDSWIKTFDRNYVNYLQLLGNRVAKPWIKTNIKIFKGTNDEIKQRNNDDLEELRPHQ